MMHDAGVRYVDGVLLCWRGIEGETKLYCVNNICSLVLGQSKDEQSILYHGRYCTTELKYKQNIRRTIEPSDPPLPAAVSVQFEV